MDVDYCRDMLWCAWKDGISEWFDSLSLKDKYRYLKNGDPDGEMYDQVWKQPSMKELTEDVQNKPLSYLEAFIRSSYAIDALHDYIGMEPLEYVTPQSTLSPENRAMTFFEAILDKEIIEIEDYAHKELHLSSRLVHSEELGKLLGVEEEEEV